VHAVRILDETELERQQPREFELDLLGERTGGVAVPCALRQNQSVLPPRLHPARDDFNTPTVHSARVCVCVCE